jgi:signal transduction histidine kinase
MKKDDTWIVDHSWLSATTSVGVAAYVESEATSRTIVKAALVCVSGPRIGTSFTITDKPMMIGRERADLQIAETEVSRRHARVALTGRGYVVEDLQSSNGTFLNGTRLERPMVVNVGDRIQIGTTVLVLSQHDELAEKVARMQRLESMATLAGGIAHDFNNALMVIMANVEVVAEELAAGGNTNSRSLDEIREATNSATALARRLLRLGRVEPLPLASVDLRELVAKTAAMAHKRNPVIEITLGVPDELLVRGAYDELQQVVLNLCINAVDAMPNGGRLSLAARAATLPVDEALARQLPTGGEYVELLISDTGTGMDAATLSRAFEPFFTTKARDRGTGLGLAMVHSSIRRHLGAIDVTSTLGAGTTFRVTLPSA